MRALAWIIGIVILLGAVFAAIYFGLIRPGGTQEITDRAIVECTEECAARAQCGTRQSDGALVVLGGADGPTVEPESHNRFFISGNNLAVNSTAIARVKGYDDGGQQEDITFYRLEQAGTEGQPAKAAWVAQWCVRAPEQ